MPDVAAIYLVTIGYPYREGGAAQGHYLPGDIWAGLLVLAGGYPRYGLFTPEITCMTSQLSIWDFMGFIPCHSDLPNIFVTFIR